MYSCLSVLLCVCLQPHLVSFRFKRQTTRKCSCQSSPSSLGITQKMTMKKEWVTRWKCMRSLQCYGILVTTPRLTRQSSQHYQHHHHFIIPFLKCFYLRCLVGSRLGKAHTSSTTGANSLRSRITSIMDEITLEPPCTLTLALISVMNLPDNNLSRLERMT